MNIFWKSTREMATYHQFDLNATCAVDVSVTGEVGHQPGRV